MDKPGEQLKVGQAAPDIVVTDTAGNPVRLSSYWKNGPTLVNFLRHFGCIHCRARLAELEQRHEDIQAAGLQQVALALGEPKHAERYCGKLAPHLECLADDKNDGYYDWGLQQATISDLFSHGVDIMKASLKAAANGHMQGRATGDANMLPGTFIIDSDGIVRYAYYSAYAGDNPAIDTLVQIARDMQQGA